MGFVRDTVSGRQKITCGELLKIEFDVQFSVASTRYLARVLWSWNIVVRVFMCDRWNKFYFHSIDQTGFYQWQIDSIPSVCEWISESLGWRPITEWKPISIQLRKRAVSCNCTQITQHNSNSVLMELTITIIINFELSRFRFTCRTHCDIDLLNWFRFDLEGEKTHSFGPCLKTRWQLFRTENIRSGTACKLTRYEFWIGPRRHL